MEGVMAVAYGVTIVIFVPLFISFENLLKRSFEPMYRRMKLKIYLTFVGFMSILTFRYLVYNLIQFSSVAWLDVETLRGEIPLYISEVLIALCYMRIMVSTYQDQKRKLIIAQAYSTATDQVESESTVSGMGGHSNQVIIEGTESPLVEVVVQGASESPDTLVDVRRINDSKSSRPSIVSNGTGLLYQNGKMSSILASEHDLRKSIQ